MPPESDAPNNSLNDLLEWLDSDREVAISIYLDLRVALIRIFSWNGCADPPGMTDDTFDRVAKKLPQLKETFEGERRLYFYGVANNLIKEYRKKLKLLSKVDSAEPSVDPPQEAEEEQSDLREECLNTCLQELNKEKRELILSYYSKERDAKIIHRSNMARDLGISHQALRVRMLRIRLTLEACIERCLDELEGKSETD
jgi:RNA polymerase sigma factor (sigma-70 family)